MLYSCPTSSHFSLPHILEKNVTLVQPSLWPMRRLRPKWIITSFVHTTEGLPRPEVWPGVWVTWESHPCHHHQRTCIPSEAPFTIPRTFAFIISLSPHSSLMRRKDSKWFWPLYKRGDESLRKLLAILSSHGWQVAEPGSGTAPSLHFLSTGSPCLSERPSWPCFLSFYSVIEIYRTYAG